MQDDGPFHDEPPPTDEELRAARALADELDGLGPETRGALADTARAARATVREERPLDRSVVDRGIADGLSRRRRASRLVAFTALAAAAIAIAGVVVTSLVAPPGPGDEAGPRPSLPPSLSALPLEPFPEGQRASERVDHMARLAVSDWWTGQLARASAEGAR